MKSTFTRMVNTTRLTRRTNTATKEAQRGGQSLQEKFKHKLDRNYATMNFPPTSKAKQVQHMSSADLLATFPYNLHAKLTKEVQLKNATMKCRSACSMNNSCMPLPFQRRRHCSVALTLLLSAWLLATTQADVQVEGNTYAGLYVGFSPHLKEAECSDMRNNLQAVLTDASALLFNVTGGRLQFPPLLRVVLPPQWTTCGGAIMATAPPGWSYDTAPLRLGPTHPLFGDEFWTQQPRQCGQPGDFIYLTSTLMKRSPTLAARRLVSEWAKFRWGAMEEVGHLGDVLYPPAYSTPGAGGGSNYLPTSCANAQLHYDTSSCNTEASCEVSLTPSDNPTPTASLLSLPHLPNVVELCTPAGHNPSAPTKHNVLCGRRSVEDLFTQHPDHNTLPQVGPPWKVQVEAVRAMPVSASVVVVFQNNLKMDEFDYSMDFLKDSLCQLIVNYLQEDVYLGVVEFAQTPAAVGEAGISTSAKQQALCARIQALQVPQTSARSLVAAVAAAAEVLAPGGGSILLVTRHDAPPTEAVSEAAAAAGTNTVTPVLYPAAPAASTNWFDELAALTGGGLAAVVAEVRDGLTLAPVMRRDLSAALRQFISAVQPRTLLLKDSGSCEHDTRDCTFNLYAGASPVPSLLSVYYATIKEVNYSPSPCVDVTALQTSKQTSNTYNCTSLSGTIQVTTEAKESNSGVYAELVEVKDEEAEDEADRIVVWATHNLRDLKYTSTTAPAVFVQVWRSGRQVVGANVQMLVEWGGITSFKTQLSDGGVGADITGHDGVASAFLSGVPSVATALTITVTAAAPPGQLLPTAVGSVTVECCGSSLRLPPDLDQAPAFSATTVVRARVTAAAPDNLPPGRVTDLVVQASGGAALLTFTAPGDDLSTGTVSSYTVKVFDNATLNTKLNFSSGLVSGGLEQLLQVPSAAAPCGVLLRYTVAAADGQGASGGASNEARCFISCAAPSAGPLTAGAIVGIVIACILLLIILMLLVYIAVNWKNRDELSVWQCLTCRSCKKENRNKIGNKKTNIKQRSDSTKIKDFFTKPVVVIRDLSDLYSHTDADKKDYRSSLNARDNGGFEEPRQFVTALNAPGDVGSIHSFSSSNFHSDVIPYDNKTTTLQTTLPINNIGIPETSRQPPDYGHQYMGPHTGPNSSPYGPLSTPKLPRRIMRLHTQV